MPSRFCNSYKEAAEYSGFTERQLKRMVATHQLGVNKFARNRVVFLKSELDALFAKTWVRALK